MPQIITCRCGQQLEITESMHGQRLGCPTCGAIVDLTAWPRPGDVAAGSPPALPGMPEEFRSSGRSNGSPIAIVFGSVALVLLLVCGGLVFVGWRTVQKVASRVQAQMANLSGRPLREHDEDYAEARKTFRTQLEVAEPSPQEFEPYSPPGRKISFQSGNLTLFAYVDPPPADGLPRPAVLFLHGGFALGDGDWEMPQPYRDAGYIVMIPALRGENGLPGSFTLFYDEVDDVLAAADSLAELPYVDKNQIFVSGHSAGGTLAALAAMASSKFRGAASLSGSMNQTINADMAPFDISNDLEFEMRSPVSFPGSFKCPTRLYYGTQEFLLSTANEQTARAATARGRDVATETSPGDHFTSVPPSIQKSIAFFNQLQAK